MTSPHVAVGVDATPDGWVAVRYGDDTYEGVYRYSDDPAPDADAAVDGNTAVDASAAADAGTPVDANETTAPGEDGDASTAFDRLWRDHRDADVVLVDVPIGLSDDAAARRPERAARDVLGPRAASVFNVPIRPVLHTDSYDAANAEQRDAIDKGLTQQTYNITHRIREVDARLGDPDSDATQDVVRESHPEVCFWALAGDRPMAYSKTGQPAAAHWERVGVLATVHDDPENVHDALADAGAALVDWHDPQLSNDDLLDAFALAVTGSTLTGDCHTLPEDPDTDPTGLRMEMVYARPKNQ